jgi:hypothetical protein
MKTNLILMVLFVFLFSNCRKENNNIVEDNDVIEKEVNWELVNQFTGENGIVLNSFAAKDRIYFSVINAWCSLDFGNNYDGTLKEYYLNKSVEKKVPITEELFAYYNHYSYQNSDEITINSTTYCYQTELPHYSLELIDTASTYIDKIFRKKNCMSISNSSYCLVPTHTKQNQPAFYIIKPRLYKSGNQIIVDHNVSHSIISKVVIENEETKNIETVDSYYDNFFVSCDSKAYMIDTLGNFVPIINEKIWQFINKSDSIIAISMYHDDKSAFNTYVSKDKGLTWNKTSDIPSKDMGNVYASSLVFSNVNNELIAFPAYEYGALYHLVIKNGQYELKSMKSKGLENCDITSISYFNKQVYITTLSGVYVKKWDYFIDYIKPD